MGRPLLPASLGGPGPFSPRESLGSGLLLGDAPSPGLKLLCSLRRASNKVWQGCELLRWLLSGKDVSGGRTDKGK